MKNKKPSSSKMINCIAIFLFWVPTWLQAVNFAKAPLTFPPTTPTNVLLSLSTGYQTADVAAYATSDFSPTQAYDGYFDSNKCYQYSSTQSNPNISTPTPDEYFYPVATTSAANNYTCTNAWSGNFLNWLTMTKLDLFRKALTGGTREFDTPTSTYLVRSFIDGRGQITLFPDVTISGTTVTLYTPLPYPSASGSTSYIIANTSPTNYGQSCRDGCNSGELYGSRFRIIDPNNLQVGANLGQGASSSNNYNNLLKISVQVCNVNAPGGLENNCSPYSTDTSGNRYYKPTGLIQLNQNIARFGTFSYVAIDNLDQREGGLMREFLKSIGNSDFTSNYTFQSNPSPEIDPSTGIFIYDPDGIYSQAPKSNAISAPIYQTSQQNWSNSGLINYINQFGYKSISTMSGWHYTGFDNAAELYYEALRYLSLPYNGQSRGATPEYKKNIKTGQLFSSTVNDGFPLLTTYTDPILDKCQNNNVIFLGHANTQCDGRIPGGAWYSGQSGSNGANGQCANARDPSNTVPDLYASDWIGWIESLESGYSNIDSKSKNSMNCPGGSRGCYSGFAGPNIAGLAYWARIANIRPELSPFLFVTTYIMDVHSPLSRSQNGSSPYAFGQDKTNLWFATKYGGFDYDPIQGNWNPNDNNTTWDSNGDGIPNTFIKSDSSIMISNSLNAIFTGVKSFKTYNSNSSIATSVNQFNVKDTQIYKTYYAHAGIGQWEGNLASSIATATINSSGQVTYNTGNPVDFNQGAAGWLQNNTIDGNINNPRQIIMATRTAQGGTLTGVPFQWNAIGTYTQNVIKNTGETDSDGKNRLNYVRGDRSNEQSISNPSGFRPRPNTVLGDIIDSSPIYVGPSLYGFSDSDFPAGNPSYNVFFQNNIFRSPIVYVGANDGMLHAFDANTLKEIFSFIPNSIISKLNNFSSLSYTHDYFVDETPIISENIISGKGWVTELIGFPGIGGSGVFALDITSPDKLSQAESNANNIVLWELNSQTDKDIGNILNRGQMSSKNKSASQQVGRISNGHWAIITGNGYNPPSNKTGLVVIYLDTPATNGTPLYKKVMISGVTGGLSTPTPVDIDFDGKIDYAYAGDLNGNVWRFDLRNNDESQWTAFKIFTAIDVDWGTNLPQSISVAPAVMTHCTGKGLMVIVGTGTYFDVNDNNHDKNDGVYGLWDKFDNVEISVNDLVAQYYVDFSQYNSYSTTSQQKLIIITTNNTVDWSSKNGWRFVNVGDKVVTPPRVMNGIVYFNDMYTSANDTCGSFSILNQVTTLNACTGQRPDHSVLDINFDGIVNTNDTVQFNGETMYASGIATPNDWSQLQDNLQDTSIWIDPKAIRCTDASGATCNVQTGFINGWIGIDLGSKAPSRLTWREIPSFN